MNGAYGYGSIGGEPLGDFAAGGYGGSPHAGRHFESRNNASVWRKAAAAGEALLIGYLVAGDPDPERSLEIAGGIVAAGVDIVEIGVPSVKPKLDGEIIRRGHQRALRSDSAAEGQLPLSYWRELRERIGAPIWAMGYRRELVDTGLCDVLAKRGWIDALLLPDCPLSEQKAIQARLSAFGVDVVRFAHSAMNDRQLREATDGATIVYAQTYSGTTGDPLAELGDLSGLCERIRRHTDAIVVAGFGLRTAERVRKAVAGGFDGAVVGTALVARCERGEWDSLYRLIADMKWETKR